MNVHTYLQIHTRINKLNLKGNFVFLLMRKNPLEPSQQWQFSFLMRCPHHHQYAVVSNECLDKSTQASFFSTINTDFGQTDQITFVVVSIKNEIACATFLGDCTYMHYIFRPSFQTTFRDTRAVRANGCKITIMHVHVNPGILKLLLKFDITHADS